MSQQVHTPIQAENRATPDLLVIGAGIFGLWAARHALKRGERVLVIEKRGVGAGASGGFLGALMPHMPDRWNDKKQMQYEGLYSLERAIGELEADTGLKCGYRRCGRLMPLRHERMLDHLAARVAGASQNWVDATGRPAFAMEHVPPGELTARFVLPDGRPWLSREIAPFGAAYDTLSARLDPRACLAALACYVREHENGTILEGAGVAALDPEAVRVSLADGGTVSAGRILIANGWEAYGLLSGIGARIGRQNITGRGVKGQAVLVNLPHGDDLPILYDSGSYVVPHGKGPQEKGLHGKAMGEEAGIASRVAVGSTSIDDWLPEGAGEAGLEEKALEMARTGYDVADTGFFDHARALCPAIASAPVMECWANIRPRNTIPDPETGKIGTEPVFGPLEGHERISVAAGGFKISFALAHLSY